MSVGSVCLPVTNPAGGRSMLYGQRFTDGPVDPSTPAIVLVHGIASSTEDWDLSPTWSVARALASAGYVVFVRPARYAKSSYFSQPGGGHTLTTAAHRAMLHDVVGDVKTGGYRTTAGTDCTVNAWAAGEETDQDQPGAQRRGDAHAVGPARRRGGAPGPGWASHVIAGFRDDGSAKRRADPTPNPAAPPRYDWFRGDL
jgi:hypothetical protein